MGEQHSAESLILIGKIVKTHGIKGQVKVYPLTDFIDRFEDLDNILLKSGAEYREYTIAGCAFVRDMPLLKLENVDTVEMAEALIGNEIYIPLSARGELPEDTYYFDDIEGFTVVSTTGAKVGTLTDIMHLPASDCLVIDRSGKEVLIPFVPELALEVDLENSTITVVDMPSLWEEESQEKVVE